MVETFQNTIAFLCKISLRAQSGPTKCFTSQITCLYHAELIERSYCVPYFDVFSTLTTRTESPFVLV